MKTGQKIAEYMKAHHIRQIDVSRATGISAPDLNRILKGKKPLTLERYEILCTVLSVPLETFLENRIPAKKSSGEQPTAFSERTLLKPCVFGRTKLTQSKDHLTIQIH